MEGLEFEPPSTFIESLHHFLLYHFCVKNQKQRGFCRMLWSPNSIVVFTSNLTKYGGKKEHSYCGFLTCRFEMNTDDMISPRSSWDSEAEEQATRSTPSKLPRWEQLWATLFRGCSLKLDVWSFGAFWPIRVRQEAEPFTEGQFCPP